MSSIALLYAADSHTGYIASLFFLPSDTCLLLCFRRLVIIYYKDDKSSEIIYALKEITAGDQFEIEIYPQFRSMDEVPPEGRTIKKDNNKAQKNLNDKNARKYVERLICFRRLVIIYYKDDKSSENP